MTDHILKLENENGGENKNKHSIFLPKPLEATSVAIRIGFLPLRKSEMKVCIKKSRVWYVKRCKTFIYKSHHNSFAWNMLKLILAWQ